VRPTKRAEAEKLYAWSGVFHNAEIGQTEETTVEKFIDLLTILESIMKQSGRPIPFTDDPSD
jgi:hypothetical protein